jgi:hypothetical protein
MNEKHKLRTLAACVLVLTTLSLSAQDISKTLTILLVNGKTGKPMKNERLLVFFGSSPPNVRMEKGFLDPHTNANGAATLRLDEPNLAYLQVWADFRTLCQSDPNDRSFSVADIMKSGVQSPNNCGKIVIPNSPGRLIVYARHSTFREEMAR